MWGHLLQAESEARGLILDPRTKLLMMVTMAAFILGAAGNGLAYIPLCLSAVPLLLLLTAKRPKAAALYVLVYGTGWLSLALLGPHLSGVLNFLVLGSAGITTRFMPTIMMGVYVVSTTTVSEFTGAMERMRVSEKIVIPASIMFRFFPTVADEFVSINAAMRMRGVSLGGKNVTSIVEYRLVPLLTCSAKIGEELSAAALTRGLGGEVKRTNVCEIGFHVQDLAAMALCAVPVVLAVLSRLNIM